MSAEKLAGLTCKGGLPEAIDLSPEDAQLVAREYLRVVHGESVPRHILEELPGWVPQFRSPKRVTVKPKRYLADPSLAVASLGMSPAALMRDWQSFGLVFENPCVRDLSVYAGVASLKRLRAKLSENPRSRTRPPEFMAVLTGVSSYARKVEEGIYAIPIACLGA